MLWPRHLFLVALASFWCGIILVCPWMIQMGHKQSSLWLTLFFSQICHQDPSRSFSIAGAWLPVCSRCSALYFGGLAGILVYSWLASLASFERRLKHLVFWGSLPCLLDIGLDLSGVWNNTFLSRSLTGSLLGLAAGLCLAQAVQKFSPPSDLTRQHPNGWV